MRKGIVKLCAYCGHEFTAKHDYKEYKQECCSRSCRLNFKIQNNPEYLLYITEKIKKNNNPDEKAFRIKQHKEYYNDPINKEIRRAQTKEIITELWKDPDFAHKVRVGGFKAKEYLLPSGNIVKIQGWEPIALDNLLQIYQENDIAICDADIQKEIGRISYEFENKQRTYRPDLYIRSTNTIIEVKSTWTFKKDLAKNIAKKQACLKLGFNFEFMIFNNKKQRVDENYCRV